MIANTPFMFSLKDPDYDGRFVVMYPPWHNSRRNRRAEYSRKCKEHKSQSRGRPYRFESQKKSDSVIRGRKKQEALIARADILRTERMFQRLRRLLFGR